MHFGVALVLYIILFLVILCATWKFGINLFSAVTVAALISAIFLLALIPPSQLDKFTDEMVDGCEHENTNSAAVALVCIIFIITLVLIIWYVLETAYCDRIVFNNNSSD